MELPSFFFHGNPCHRISVGLLHQFQSHRCRRLRVGDAGDSDRRRFSGFPVVPVAITGTADPVILGNVKRLRKSNITLTGGKPFILPPLPKTNRDRALKNYTDEIMCQIAALLPERYRGVYANHPRLKELLQT